MDKHADLMESIGKGLGSVRDAVTDPKILPYLLSGGAGAAAGGFLTARTPERPGEDRVSRRKRILRNAALLGAGTAGAHKLIDAGLPGITTPKPPGGPTVPQAALEGINKNPAYYGVAGGTLATLVARMSGKEEARNAGTMLHNIKGKAPKLEGLNGRGVLWNKLVEMTSAGGPLKTEGGAGIPNSEIRGAGINPAKLTAGSSEGGVRSKLKGAISTAWQNKHMLKDPVDLYDQALGRYVNKVEHMVQIPGSFRRALKSLPGRAFGALSPASQEGTKLFGERVTGVNRGGGAVAKRLGLLAALAGLIPQGISRATRAYDPEAFVE